MKRNKITTAMAVAALAILLGSCADMIWGVDTEAGVGVSDYSPYYGYYNNGIWDNALNGFYGPMWSAPPVYRPPYRPGWTEEIPVRSYHPQTDLRPHHRDPKETPKA
jgi:hypothetical protein